MRSCSVMVATYYTPTHTKTYNAHQCKGITTVIATTATAQTTQAQNDKKEKSVGVKMEERQVER